LEELVATLQQFLQLVEAREAAAAQTAWQKR